MFSSLSHSPHQLRDKIDIFIALAPIVNLHNSVDGMIDQVASQWRFWQSQARILKIYELYDPKVDKNLKTFCGLFKKFCDDVSK